MEVRIFAGKNQPGCGDCSPVTLKVLDKDDVIIVLSFIIGSDAMDKCLCVSKVIYSYT